jgi:hypothetical protein
VKGHFLIKKLRVLAKLLLVLAPYRKSTETPKHIILFLRQVAYIYPPIEIIWGVGYGSYNETKLFS